MTIFQRDLRLVNTGLVAPTDPWPASLNYQTMVEIKTIDTIKIAPGETKSFEIDVMPDVNGWHEIGVFVPVSSGLTLTAKWKEGNTVNKFGNLFPPDKKSLVVWVDSNNALNPSNAILEVTANRTMSDTTANLEIEICDQLSSYRKTISVTKV